MNNLKLVSWAICLHLLMAINAYGNIYKCIESDGTLKFQDYPCTNQENQKTEIFHQYTKNNHGENTKNETKSDQINPCPLCIRDDFLKTLSIDFGQALFNETKNERVRSVMLLRSSFFAW